MRVKDQGARWNTLRKQDEEFKRRVDDQKEKLWSQEQEIIKKSLALSEFENAIYMNRQCEKIIALQGEVEKELSEEISNEIAAKTMNEIAVEEKENALDEAVERELDGYYLTEQALKVLTNGSIGKNAVGNTEIGLAGYSWLLKKKEGENSNEIELVLKGKGTKEAHALEEEIKAESTAEGKVNKLTKLLR